MPLAMALDTPRSLLSFALVSGAGGWAGSRALCAAKDRASCRASSAIQVPAKIGMLSGSLRRAE